MDTVLLQILKDIFKKFPQFWNGEKLQRSLVIDAIQKKDPQVIKALIANEKVKSIYGTEIDDVLIFDFDKLASLLKYKEYWADSFTKYRNKVGLTSSGKYLDYSSDVVLDFPFKDCVLEGGMTKEDQRKDEVYYNEVIARDEIDRLFSPKVFINSKRYTKDGVEENVNQFNDDNLIIKGNNLIALHSLKESYSGKVKLIYIDPPYNTGNDGFKYNDSFNHSTWLTFMKNRLEIAKDLLSVDGSIFIQIDSYEESYLKILMDEIFGAENFRNKITWKRRGGSANPSNQLNNVVEWILWYSKDSSMMDYMPIYSLDDDNTKKYIKERFTNVDIDGRLYMKSPIQSPNHRDNLIYDYKGYKTPKKGYSVSKDVMERWDRDGKLDFPDSKDKNINRKIFLDEYKGQPINSLWTDIYVINPMSLERVDFTSGQKPEALLQRMMRMTTREKDIVLDFHLGSGTTACTAHKMGRRYIGIEQMDYINEITIPRLQKVIDGEQGGISKDINWQGGGSFVYTELMELNYVFLHKIEQAQSTVDLLELFELMKAEAHLNYQIALDKVLGAEYEIDGVDHLVLFNELELLEQKKLLIALLDKNQLYVNASEMGDVNLAISESDKAFTKSFYQKDC
jgi:adenine-specific DNA-methyltransferase